MERKLKIVSVGEEKVASDNRAYYALEVIDAANPFAPSKKRNIFQQFDSEGNAVWRVPNGEQAKKMVGTMIPGEIVTRTVKPYDIVDTKTGESRSVNTYSTFIFGHETVPQVFKSQDHEIVEEGALAKLQPSEHFDAAPNPSVLG